MGTSPGGIHPPSTELGPRRIYGPSKAKRRKPVRPTGPIVQPVDQWEEGPAGGAPVAPSVEGDPPNTNDPHVPMT